MIPRLETDRLILREQRNSDFDAYAGFWASDRSTEYGFGGPFDRARSWDGFAADAGHWILHGYGCWMAEEKATGTPVGWMGFYFPDRYEEPELGWTLFEEFEGKSFAFEASLAARRYGQEHFGLKAVASFIDAQNTRSINLAERLGATREDTRDRGDGPFHVYRHPEVT